VFIIQGDMMRIKRLISQMSLEEKVQLLTGKSLWETQAIERLGISSVRMTDGPHGVRNEIDMEIKEELQIPESIKATCFPTASAMGSTWNAELIKSVGKALGDECKEQGIQMLLGPGNNIKRLPICGRNFEYFSEDPFLAGELAAAYINGLQSRGIGAVLKHFAVNNQEYERHRISAEVSERVLREIYLATFKRAVTKGKPWGVMAAYNRMNGTHCTENTWLLNNVLRNEWGYDGIVISDWGAVQNRVAALKAGTDLEMPGPREESATILMNALMRGDLDEDVVNRSVARILHMVERSDVKNHKHHSNRVVKHHTIAQKVAEESIVLLKNDKHLLPLKKEWKIAVIGLAAKEPRFQGGGSSEVNANEVDIPYGCIEAIAHKAVLFYAPGYTMEDEERPVLIDDAVEIAKRADVAIIFAALPPYKESEFYDREDMILPQQQINLIKAVAKQHPKTIVILNNGSPLTMELWHNNVSTIVEAWLSGEGGGEAIAKILFGETNPSGRLAETFPLRYEDTPAYIHYPGENHKAFYGEGIFVGYRYYDKRKMDVLYPFGFGLSYTTFEYKKMKLSRNKMKDVDLLEIQIKVQNTGKLPGYEVVQLYLNDVECSISRPKKELKAFKKVWIEPGVTETIRFMLSKEDFCFFDPKYGRWVVETGDFEILVGKSSAEICLKAQIHVIATDELPSRLHLGSTLREWLQDRKGRKVINRLIKMFRINPRTLQSSKKMNIDVWRAAQDIPLKSLLEHIRIKLPVKSDRIVKYLLDKDKEKNKK